MLYDDSFITDVFILSDFSTFHLVKNGHDVDHSLIELQFYNYSLDCYFVFYPHLYKHIFPFHIAMMTMSQPK